MKASEDVARTVLKQVLESSLSDFYRDKYAGDGAVIAASAGGNWEQVPFLTREEIQAVGFWDRLYVPAENLDAIRPTSGTSGHAVMALPRIARTAERNSVWHHAFFQELPLKRLASFSGAQFLYAESFHQKWGVDSLQLLPSEPRVSAALLEQYKPDILAGFPYAITTLLPYLKERDALSSIRVVQLFGEWCTYLEWEYLRAHLPDTPIFIEYASMETQSPVAETCWASARAHEPYVHTIPEYAHVELIDPDTGEIIQDTGVRGEMVVTTLRPVAFPLIRYRTGDAATIVSQTCECGNPNPVLRIEGRMELDRLRFAGGELHVAEMDRVLHRLHQYVTCTDFEIEYAEISDSQGRLLPQLTVYLACENPHTSAEDIAHLISNELHVAPGKTYATGVAGEEYMPLTVLYRDTRTHNKKRVRITRAHPIVE